MLWWTALSVAGLVALATAVKPTVGLFVVGAAVLAAIAARSPALPLVLSGTALAALVLGGRLPQGGTVAAYSAWIFLGLVIALVRGHDLPRAYRVVNVGSVSLIAILGLMILRLPASADYSYGRSKIELLLLTAILPMLVAVIVGYRASDRRILLVATALVGVATAVYGSALIALGISTGIDDDRLSFNETIDPIGLGRSMSTVILVLVFFFIRARHARTRLFSLLAVLPAAAVLIGSGSRGPLLGLVVGVPVLIVGLSGQPAALRRGLVAIGASLLGAAVMIATIVPPEAASRVLSIFGSPEQEGELSRYALWSEALGIMARDAPSALIGIGTGGYAELTQYKGMDYPHNILIETALELGVVGLLVLVVGFAWLFSRAFAMTRVTGEPGAFAAYLLAVLATQFVAAQFSGDLPYNNDLWVTGGLIVGLAADVARRREAGPPPETVIDDAAAAPVVAERPRHPRAPVPVPARALRPAPIVPTVGARRERYAATILLYAMAPAFLIALVTGIALDAAGFDSLSLPTGRENPLAAPWRGWTLVIFGVLGIVATIWTARRRLAIARARATASIGFGGLAVTGVGMLAGSPVITAAGFVAALLPTVMLARARRQHEPARVPSSAAAATIVGSMTNGRDNADGFNTAGQASLQNELQSLAGLLDRRKWVIIASVVGTVLLALVFTLRQEKVYQSSAIIAVTTPTTGAASQTDQATAARSAAGSQIVVITSSGYRERAAAALEVDRRKAAADAQADTTKPDSELTSPITPFLIEKRITAGTIGETELIRISATGPTPGAARALADVYAAYVVRQSADDAKTVAATEVEALQTQASGIRKQISSLTADLRDASTAGNNTAVDNLTEQINALRATQTQLTLQIAQVGSASGSGAATLRVASPSTDNDTAVSPRLQFNLAIAAVVGLFLGLLLAWIRDQLDRTVRSVDEIESLTNSPVLATIPLVREPDALSTPALADAYSFLRVNLGVTLEGRRRARSSRSRPAARARARRPPRSASAGRWSAPAAACC